ncbi:lactose-binding lectin l-2-like [Trematomus bernacchii]|uniref:lactose-binding lectin l-2-like n=1 Tax=Trematomus bernacchii TaxID=40690 RepID=UPI00146A0425|nr:lactose-binding lectin l-2-like [Trematomus bernacchii]
MLLFLFLLGLALGAVSPSDDPQVKLERGSCPMFWFSFNDRCYKYTAAYLTWAEAEFHCVSDGANLVSIHSKAEDDFVTSLIKNFDPAEGRTWIGLSDVHQEGRWMWSDGCAAKLFFWDSGEPNNDGNENCGHTNHNPKWNDLKCWTPYPSVCASRITCP